MAHINKVHSVRTIALIARELNKQEDWLADIATEMEPEDGLIWVYSPDHEDAIMAFTRDGVENLINLIDIHREQCD